jgi:opacity protein-like surface antigen
MRQSKYPLAFVTLALAGLTLGAAAQAQTAASGSSYGSNWYAPAGGRYIGLNVGSADYFGNCSLSDSLALNCDSRGTAYSLYTGGMWNNNFGLELGATDFGHVNRAGGRTKAYGFNVSGVGRLPLTQSVALVGKLGAIYSRSNVTASQASGVATGNDDGWGATYGVGVNFDLTPKLVAVVQWDQSHLWVTGTREHINLAAVGLKYRF